MYILNIVLIFVLFYSCAEGGIKGVGEQVYQDSKLSLCQSTCRASLKKDDYDGINACNALCRRQTQNQ